MKKTLLIITAITIMGCTKTPEGMTLVEGGEFTYGSSASGKNITPEKTITLENFYIDINEVTNEQYREFIKATGEREPSNWMLNGFDKTKANHPVTFVKLDNAKNYCKWLGKTLPTQAQWERAARGTDGRQYAWGDEFKAGLSNTVTSKIIGTSPVGNFPDGVSPYGVMDLTGNVLEWTSSTYKEADSDEVSYVTKGGSWGLSSTVTKTYNRFLYDKDTKINNLGFRCLIN